MSGDRVTGLIVSRGCQFIEKKRIRLNLRVRVCRFLYSMGVVWEVRADRRVAMQCQDMSVSVDTR